MPYYLVQTSYTSQSMAAMLKNPQDRIEKVRPVVEALGGTIIAGYLSFVDYDIAAIAEMPDTVSMAAFSKAVSAAGGVSTFKTTPLLSPEEAVAAMEKAGVSGYKPPA